jgi:uncharacterized protein YegL
VDLKERDLNIFFLLDGSGSMAKLQEDVVGGLNSFIEEQQKAKSKTRFWLTVFDTRVTAPFEAADITDVPKLNTSTTLLGGCTALLDALGKTLIEAEKAKDVKKRENLVIVYTDGEENASKEFTKNQIAQLREKLEGQGNWTFTFMGADFDAFAEASKYGFANTNTATVTKDHLANFAFISDATMTHRTSRKSGNAASFYR